MIRNNFFWLIYLIVAHFQLTQGALLRPDSAKAFTHNNVLREPAFQVQALPLDQDLEQKASTENAVVTINDQPRNYGGDPFLSMLPLEIQELIKEYYVHPMQFYPAIARTIILPEKHDGSIEAIAITPDASTIVSASKDHTAKIWRGNQCVATLQHAKEIFAAAISNDGKTIVTGSYDRTVKIWDSNGKQEHTIQVTSEVNSVAIASNGTSIVGCWDRKIHIYEQQQLIDTFTSGKRSILAILAPDDSIIANCADGSTIWRHNDIKKTVLQGHAKASYGLAIAPDLTIVTGSDDHTAKIWVDGKCKATLQHPKEVRRVAIVPYKNKELNSSKGTIPQLPDDNIIVTGCSNNGARIWKNDECWIVFPSEHGNAIALTSDGTIVTGNSVGQVIIHAIDHKELKNLHKLDLERLEQLKQLIQSVATIARNQQGLREISALQCCERFGWISQFYNLWNVFDELVFDELGVQRPECQPMLLALPDNDLQQLHDILLVIHKQRCEELKKSDKKHNNELPVLTLTKEQSLFLVNKIYGLLIHYVLATFNCRLFSCDEVIDHMLKQAPEPEADAAKIKQLIKSIIAIPADAKGYRRISFEQWKTCVSLNNKYGYINYFTPVAHVMNIFCESQELKDELGKLSNADQKRFYHVIEPIAAQRRDELAKSGKKDFSELAPFLLNRAQTNYLLSLSPLVRNHVCKYYNLILTVDQKIQRQNTSCIIS